MRLFCEYLILQWRGFINQRWTVSILLYFGNSSILRLSEEFMCIIQLMVSQLVHFVSRNLWRWFRFAVEITLISLVYMCFVWGTVFLHVHYPIDDVTACAFCGQKPLDVMNHTKVCSWGYMCFVCATVFLQHGFCCLTAFFSMYGLLVGCILQTN